MAGEGNGERERKINNSVHIYMDVMKDGIEQCHSLAQPSPQGGSSTPVVTTLNSSQVKQSPVTEVQDKDRVYGAWGQAPESHGEGFHRRSDPHSCRPALAALQFRQTSDLCSLTSLPLQPTPRWQGSVATWPDPCHPF